jgi:DNA-binding protein H-NS
MSVADLRQLANAAETRIRDKAEGEKRALKEEMERRVAELGVSIQELFGEPGQPAKRGRAKAAKKSEGSGVQPKYKGPSGELWSGRGRMPRWLQAAQADGKSKDDFLIQ